MRTLILKLIRQVQLWALRTCEVARFEGIILADLRSEKARSPHFPDLILAALRLIKETDPRRFERVRRRSKWIVNRAPLYGGAQYRHHLQASFIRLCEPSPTHGREALAAWYARVLVHEATHGEIEAHGIRYTPELRCRIERLCVREEQRFVTRLGRTQPDMARWLSREFNASDWAQSWNTTWTQRFFDATKRLFQADDRQG